jgi:hypothetical protein
MDIVVSLLVQHEYSVSNAFIPVCLQFNISPIECECFFVWVLIDPVRGFVSFRGFVLSHVLRRGKTDRRPGVRIPKSEARQDTEFSHLF